MHGRFLITSTMMLLWSFSAFAQDQQRVVVMSSYPQELIARYETAFEAAHPDIDMILEWRRSDDALHLMQSGNTGVDVYWAPSLDTFVTLANAGYFDELSQPFPGLPGKIDDLEIDDPAHRFVAFEVAGFGVAFSPAWLEKHDLPVPNNWQDLRSPHYSGAVQLPVPSRQGFSPMIYASILSGLGWEQGWSLIGDIAARNTLMNNNGGTFVDELATGKLGLVLSIDFFPKSAQMNGLEVGFRYANTTLLAPAYVARLKTAPHPDAARAFINFVLSEGGQSLLLHRDVARLPVRPGAYTETADFNPFAHDVAIPSFNFRQAGAWKSLISALFDLQVSDRHERLRNILNDIDAALAQPELSTARQASLAQARQKLLAPALDNATAMQLLEHLADDEFSAADLPVNDWLQTLQRREQEALDILASSP